MGFNLQRIAETEAARERQAQRDRWIRTPGLHVVTITRWEYRGTGRRKMVVFELRDDAGRQQFVRFYLSVRELRNGELLRFAVAAMNWQPEVHAGEVFSIAHRENYDQLIGRRIVVAVTKDNQGFHRVFDWKAAPE